MASKYQEISAADMRMAMVDSQLRPNDVTDAAIVAAMGLIAREAHVPAELSSIAYMDRPIAIGHGRALNAPLVTGRMLVAADIRPGQRTLLIGAATGYMAALLTALGADVHAVEQQTELLSVAKNILSDDRVHWVEGPLAEGATSAAPFDRVIIDGAIEILPDTLVAQLADGGRMVAARCEGAVTRLVQGVKTNGTIVLRAFADMDAAPLPGFAAPREFRF